MNGLRRWLPVLLATALLAGCGRPAAGTAPASTVVIVQQREPMSLNPALENGASSTEWGMLLFSYLVKYDGRGVLVGDAAAQVPTTQNGGISRDGRTIVYHLRKNLRFADGTPLTAADCVWSIDAVNNPANDVQTRYGYDDVARAEAPDPYTLILHLKRPFAPLLTLVLAPQGFPILPKHLLANAPDFNHVAFDSHPIGSGPYVVTRWLRGDRVELRANPYYFRGVPSIAHLEIRFVPDATTAIDQLRTHEADALFNDQDLGDYPILRSLPGYRVQDAPVDAVGAVIFNTRAAFTSDVRVRRAVAYAMNAGALVAKTFRGALDGHAAGRGLFIWAYDPAAYPDVPYDLAKARALLRAAGWRTGPDGLRHKDGRTLSLLFIIQAGTPEDEIFASAVQQYEREAGVGIRLKAFNVTQFVAPAQDGGPVYGGKFDLALYPFVNGDDPDTTDQFACSHVPPAGYNKSRICDPRIDALLAAGRTTYDPAKRRAVYARLQALLYSEMPLVLIYQRRELDAFSDRIRGTSPSVDGVFWNVGAWRATASSAASNPAI